MNSLPVHIFKLFKNILVGPIKNLINKSFEYGSFPDCLKTVSVTPIEAFDLQFDLHLFLQAATVIGQNETRDLFQPITVAACKNK